MIRFARLVIPATIALGSTLSSSARERVLLDAGWRFHPGDVETANAPAFDDSSWRALDLPHDWSIELSPDPAESPAGGGGFFPAGIGWYRRAFDAPQTWEGREIVIEFEGVYRNAEVWINGEKLGRHAYGYTPFCFDLTPRIRPGARNVLAVRVDNSAQPNSRWYSGSGIYRHVWLEAREPVHLVRESIFITTARASGAVAEVRVEAAVRNAANAPARADLEIAWLDPDGAQLHASRATLEIGAGAEAATTQTARFDAPKLWSPETPALYRAVFRARVGDRVTDTWETPFGIRTIAFSAERGFELNGRAIELAGGNVHHDNGPLGAAAFDRAEFRRVELLKAAGFNAIRTAHNPPSSAFLDACDQLGMLVMDEAFDGWASAKLKHDYSEDFAGWAEKDVEAMVRRDRNHPSVVMWSIGNEVYERGNENGLRIARELAACIRKLDATRPVTAGINGLGANREWSDLDPLFATLDVAGYNYEMSRHADDHARVPDRVIVGTESFLSDTFDYWAAARDHPYVIGDFVWTAMDYLGEAGIGRATPPEAPATPHWEGVLFPWHGAVCGDIDLTGWRRPVSRYRNIVWDRGEKLHAAVLVPTDDGRPWNTDRWGTPPALPSWTWPGHEGQPLTVEVYSRFEYVRLHLNDGLIGGKPTTRAEQFKARFEVPYAPGALRIVGVDADGKTETLTMETAGAPARIELMADRDHARADGQDLVFVTAEITDEKGRRRFDAGHAIRYEVSGPAVIAGIGSADLTSRETYQANPRHAFQGRALVVLRATDRPGEVVLKAASEGLAEGVLRIRAH